MAKWRKLLPGTRVRWAILSFTFSTLPFGTYASTLVEIGAYTKLNGSPAPNAQITTTDRLGPFVANATAVADPTDTGRLILPIVQLRYNWRGFDFDVGRVALSAGLPPPVYTVTTPPASQPDVYSAFSRQVVAIVGFPEYGASVTYTTGGLALSSRVYVPSRMSQDVLQESPLFVPPDVPSVAAPLIGRITRYLLGLPQYVLGEGEADTTQPASGAPTHGVLKRSVMYQAGVYYERGPFQAAADYLRMEVPGQPADVTILDLAHSWPYLYTTLRYAYLNGQARGGLYHVSVVVPLGRYLPYARYGRSERDYHFREAAFGATVLFGPYAGRIGYEYLDFFHDKAEAIVLAVSWTFR